MTRKEYRKHKLNNFNKWFLIRFAQAFAYFATFLVLLVLLLGLFIGASNQHYEKLQLIQTGQYAGER
nr:MAG TPA: hypothetical protein [Caudoviricetes sp.]